MKKIISILLFFVFIFQSVNVFALTDQMIFVDPVENVYNGRRDVSTMIGNLNFSDVADDHWAKESIVRSGAFNMVKGYGTNYLPNDVVSKQEALAFILRALGRENEAQAAAVTLQAQLPTDSPLTTLWSIGYLNIAFQLGLITRAQYNDVLVADQATLDSALSFVYGAPATREEVAGWLVAGIRTVNPDIFLTRDTRQAMFTYNDWDNISVDKVEAVEAITSRGMMKGDNSGNFNPKGSLNRAEMAQVLKSMDSIYFDIMGLEKRTGTVGGIVDRQTTLTGSANLTRGLYIRTASGNIDLIQYSADKSSSPQSGISDVVVFKEGKVGGIGIISEGDELEYIVEPATNTIMYAQVTKANIVKEEKVQGVLLGVDVTKGSITIEDTNKKTYVYNMINGLYGIDVTVDREGVEIEGSEVTYIFLNDKKTNIKSLPVGSKVELTLKNNVVDYIKFIGEPVIVQEMRGMVTENNTEYGYISFIDNNGIENTKNYYSNDIKVEKQQYYDLDDEIGYLDEVFPNYEYDPRDTYIEDVEAGDIVFIRLDPNDQDTIVSISASPNYIMRHGQIKEFKNNDDIYEMLVEYENKQTSWFTISNEIFISKDGALIDMEDVQVGDWAKLLVNQAIIEPGNVMESVKEIAIEGTGHFISSIVKGKLSSINSIQNKLIIQNAETLSKTGWGNYKDVSQFSIAGRDIEYYHEGKRVSLEYAEKNLKRSQGDVYIALENNYSGEKVKKVTFRMGRDELLTPDTVINSDGNGKFSIVSNSEQISTDSGTIVRRLGRLVDGQSIQSPDYAVVSLNGGNVAAVVDISDEPGVSGIMIARGRVETVDEGKSFKVKSLSLLSGNEWSYSPIQREFTTDYNTLFLNNAGYVNPENFIGYTTDTAIDKVYNIVIDGARVSHVVEAPYAQQFVRGTIYEVSGNNVKIKNTQYYDTSTGRWISISNRDSSGVVTTHPNSIYGKNNAAINRSGLRVGDQIKVLTDKLPDRIVSGITIDGYIILVEK